MLTVGSYEAKTQLSKLLELVASGQTIVVSKHGKPIAKLSPVEGDTSDLLSQFLELQESVAKNTPRAKNTKPAWKLRHEGHKW